MERTIRVSSGTITIEATLDQSQTADAIWAALPLEGIANIWGQEVYFSIPVGLDEAPEARQMMHRGELAYWPAGAAFCIFFGPTPVSEGDQPRAFDKVNPFGRVTAGLTELHHIKDGEWILVERIEA
jgi:hypothetical protein